MASIAARLAFQHYGAPALAAAGWIVSSTTTGSTSSQYPHPPESSLASSMPTYCEASPPSNSKPRSAFKSPSSITAPKVAFDVRRRMTNVGRFSVLSETQTNPSIPVLVLCLSGQPWRANDFCRLYQDRRIAETHERFRSIIDPDDSSHFLALDPNVFPERSLPVQDILTYPRAYRSELKSMITDAVLQPMDLSQTLWQAWTATGGSLGQSGAISKAHATAVLNTDLSPKPVETLLLFRAHHCMADGVSLGAIFGDLMDEGEAFRQLIKDKVTAFKSSRKKKAWWKRLLMLLYYWCWGSIRALWYQSTLYFHSLFAPNPWKLLKAAATVDQSDNVDVPPRTISWVQVAPVDEVKQVADYFSQQSEGKVTINDVFCSCVSGAISKLIRYHQHLRPELDLELPYLNLVIPVHMQGGILLPGQAMGNKIGAMVNRIPAQATDTPQDRLLEVHKILWDRKQTPAALLSFLVAKTFGGSFGSVLGTWTPWFFEKAHSNASVVVTNVRGPEQVAHLEGRRVEAQLGFLPLPPGIPIGIVVTSYNQTMTLTVMAESWAVPDADLFLSWVVEEYQALLNESTKDTRKR